MIVFFCQDHPKFECLPPRPESGVPEPEDDLSPDGEEELEPTLVESDAEEDDEVEAEEEEAPKKHKRTREVASFDEGATSSFAAPSEQPKLVVPLATRSPLPELDERAPKKKKVPTFGAILSSG